MSKTVLQGMAEAAERVLTEYASAVDPLRNMILRREVAQKVANACKHVAESYLDRRTARRQAHRKAGAR